MRYEIWSCRRRRFEGVEVEVEEKVASWDDLPRAFRAVEQLKNAPGTNPYTRFIIRAIRG